MAVGLSGLGGFVFANLIFGRRGAARSRGRLAEALELEQVAEGAGVGAFEPGFGAM